MGVALSFGIPSLPVFVRSQEVLGFNIVFSYHLFHLFFGCFCFDDGDLVMAKHDFPFLCFLKWDG